MAEKDFGIIRLAKTKSTAVKAAQYHNDREPGVHSNPDIDYSRTRENEELAPHQAYKKEIEARTSVLKRKVRKDAVVLVEGLVTASPDWFKSHSAEEAEAYFRDAFEFVKTFFGEENVVHFTIHRDETTPHVHFGVTPIKNGSLSWKKFFPDKSALSKFQDAFYEQVSSKYGLSRGQKGSTARHYSVSEYKSRELRKLESEVEKTTERLEGLQSEEKTAEKDVEKLSARVEQERIRGQTARNRVSELGAEVARARGRVDGLETAFRRVVSALQRVPAALEMAAQAMPQGFIRALEALEAGLKAREPEPIEEKEDQGLDEIIGEIGTEGYDDGGYRGTQRHEDLYL